MMRRALVLFTALIFAAPVYAAAICETRPAAQDAVKRLTDVMATGRYIAYVPTSLKMIDGKATPADKASIEADLKALRPHFDGLITYNSINGEENVPAIAAKLGYRAFIIGIWDVTNTTQLNNALAAAKTNPEIVVGLSVGNEVQYGKRGSVEDVVRVMTAARLLNPHLAIATTEPFHILAEPGAAPLLEASDFMLANIHPVFEPWWRDAPDANGAEFVVNVTNDLAKVFCGPILVKETGVPTTPADKGFTPERQASFYRALQSAFTSSATRSFAYFSAFDAPWRVNDWHPVPGYHPEEGYWGIYNEKRQPKPVVNNIPLLTK